jgi:cytochrome c-type biogenesis protein CcmF
VYSKSGTSYKAFPLLSIKNFEITYKDDTVFAQNLYLRLTGITDKNEFKLSVKESDIPADFVTLKAYIFPYINLVWVGLIIMIAGIGLSLLRRVKENSFFAFLALAVVTAALFYMFLLAN